MSAPELTPVFPAHIKPVRDGVYRVLNGVGGYAYFHTSTGRWGWRYATVERAGEYRSTRGSNQDKRWQGLTNDPKDAAS